MPAAPAQRKRQRELVQRLVLLTLAAHLAGADGARAQEMEPRLYSNIPLGMNFVIAAYVHSQGNVLTDPSAALQDAHVEMNGPVLAYARSLGIGGKSGKVDVILPWACASGSAMFLGQLRTRDVCGFGDMRARLALNLLGAPALTLKEFARYRQRTILGASLQVVAPVGDYDSDKLLNLGTHRFTIKPELGLSRALGRLTLEASGSIAWFTRNDDFFGGQVKDQEPLFALQAHAVYGFRNGMWLALDATHYLGGQSTLDGVRSDDYLRSTRVGGSLSLPLSRRYSVKLHASSGAWMRTGNDFDTVALAWQIRWGGGL